VNVMKKTEIDEKNVECRIFVERYFRGYN
jgi:hypothetical protein